MIKVKYPSDIESLKQSYLAIFDLRSRNRVWLNIEKLYGVSLEKLLVGNFPDLVDIYLKYKDLKNNGTITDSNIKLFEHIFDYTSYQPIIAKFFMDPNNGFNFSTCHYCDMSYINSYGLGDSFINHLDFINHATKAEWRDHFTTEQLSDENIDMIISGREYTTMDDFNKLYMGKKKIFGKKIESYKGLSFDNNANHFDLDHLLPKSICPILGLSLFNIVPSCQVCNEKLKKAKELASTKEDWLKICPTSQDYSFDKDVTIKLIPENTCSTFFDLIQNNEKYYLYFDTNGDTAYDNYITVFRLRDRYNYHKKMALHILDLKERYSHEKRKEISKMLSARYGQDSNLYSETQIESDIFEEDFNDDRCFSKLRSDMIHKN